MQESSGFFPMLKPWYAVAMPHEDIREGRLSEAVFAANLWAVAQGEASSIYRDPEAFFVKSYLTGGMTNVLRKVSRALSGQADAGDRILSLQTSFGGGKTHALIALWHLAKHTDIIRRSAACAPVRQALGDQLPKQVKGVAVFTHQTCDATQGRHTLEGVHTRTLWGELALQLGGVELYRTIEANDQARTVPQGLFEEVLRKAAPCLILIDELADYCVGAAAVEVGGVTLADQTVSFIQQITQAVEQVPGVALVATLPASVVEVAGTEKGQEILGALEKRFGRMGADVKPVADDEIYQVVRRRLFESVGDPALHSAVADAYMKMYEQHKNEVPSEATKAGYKERIAAAFPFHPSLIDALYLRWGSHNDFQRTRGVLRLLASVIGNLWQRRHTETMSQPLIQPCHIQWTIDALHAQLTRLWGAAYEAVVAADVVGSQANAVRLDDERGGEYGTERITQGLAAAILLGSFGGQGSQAGYSAKDLKLCVGRPDLNWGYTDGALLALEDRAFYLHTASAGNLGKRYWFATKPTLTKLLVQYRGHYAAESFDDEILEAVQEKAQAARTGSATWRILVNPSADLPEQKSLNLLVMPPDCAYSENGNQMALITSPVHKRLLELSQKCGSRERLYRNILLFLLPSQSGLNKLRRALREDAALDAVKRDYWLQLDNEQREDLKKRIEAAQKSVNESISAAFTHIARIDGQNVAIAVLSEARSSFEEHVQAAWRQVVEDEEWVLRKVGPVTLQKNGLVPGEGGIRLKDAIEAFIRYTDKPMIATREAVVLGLQQACKEKMVGIGRGLSLANLQRKWCGEEVALDANEDGLWIIPPFDPTPEQTSVSGSAKTGTGGVSPGETSGTGQPTSTAGATPQTLGEGTPSTKQVRRIRVKGNVPLESWADIFRSFVNPGARLNAKGFRLGIDFEMVLQDGQLLDENDPTLKAMQESARQLGLTLSEE